MKKRKITFSQILVIFIFVVMLGTIIASYALAFHDKNPVEMIAISVITSLATTGIGYYWKSYKEKDSRNEHGLDENGVPFNLHESENEDEEH